MQLGVVGSKLKRLSTWSIWPMVENSGFQADLLYWEWHVGIIIAIHLTNFDPLFVVKAANDFSLSNWSKTLIKVSNALHSIYYTIMGFSEMWYSSTGKEYLFFWCSCLSHYNYYYYYYNHTIVKHYFWTILNKIKSL